MTMQQLRYKKSSILNQLCKADIDLEIERDKLENALLSDEEKAAANIKCGELKRNVRNLRQKRDGIQRAIRDKKRA